MELRLAAICVAELALAVALALALSDSVPEPAREPQDVQPRRAAAPQSVIGSAPAAGGRQVASATNAAHDAPAPAASATLAARGEPLHVPAVSKVHPDDPVGVLLTGAVRWRDGGPVGEPRVWAMAGKDRRIASTAKDGSYALMRLAAGEWRVNVGAEGAADLAATVAITDDAVQQRDFVLDRSFAVRVLIVTPDGHDATMATRRLLHTINDFFVAGQKERLPDRLAPTDYGVSFVGDARWQPERNPENGFAGTLSFAEPLPGYAALLLRHLVLDQQVVLPDQSDVHFVVDVEALKTRLGSATVRLVDDATGAPLAGLSVMFNTSNAMGGGPQTDADGRAVAENLLPGLLHFRVSSKDRESVYQVVRVDPGQRLDLGEVRLGAAKSLKGRVWTADGKPGAVRLCWTELKWRKAPTAFSHNLFARTEADGSFDLPGTGAGPIAVTATSSDGGIAVAVFDNPPPAPVELRLQPAAECIVTRPKDPTRSFVVTLYDGRRRATASIALEPRQLEVRLSMPPGDYAFDVHDDAGQPLQNGTLHFGTTPSRLEIR